jgi:hypothetical protein
MVALGAGDARWLNTQAAGSECSRDFLTVLDFGHPTRKFTGHASPLDDYAMSLFGHQDAWRTYREVEGLAQRYLDAWVAAASPCPRLHLVLGTSNFKECGKAVGACSVAAAGQSWDVVAHDVMAYVADKGYSQVTGIWVGDDLEASWDPWPMTATFLAAVRDQEHTYITHVPLVDYGDAEAGACSEVTGDCADPWTPEDVYAAAWGLGWDVPLPEAYTSAAMQQWDDVAAAQDLRAARDANDPLAFAGIMTECAEADPLPTTVCRPQTGGATGSGACEWSPAIAFNRLHLHSDADLEHPPAYATNIQWPDLPASAQADGSACG